MRTDAPGGSDGVTTSTEISPEELQLSQRNHGMQLEGLRYDVTPAGMHYLLIHFDVPEADESSWRLSIAGLVRT
ncbi:MAG: sulfite oxidase, partial [Actinomycetota bacterium]